uniref:Uncharacterized protein n=1 Tax=Leptobrachium leishanense TaxID=445787 RepID=A0A8C5R0U7_9ANUR
MELSKMSWYAEAFRVPFTGTKGPSQDPEKQPHTIIPPPPSFTLGTMQSDKYRSPGNHQTQNRNFTTGFVAQVASYHSSTLEFTELLRATHFFTNVCKNSLHA